MLKKIVVLALVLIVSGCGGGGGGGGDSTPTDPETVFQVFPSSMFVAGTSKTTNYTGTDNNGGSYTATISKQTQTESTFLDQATIPILYQLQFTNTGTGAVVSSLSTSFFSTSVTSRRFFGSSSETTTVSAETSIIPQTVKIGDIGNIGIYTDNAGNITTKSFRLDDGGNGNGKAVILTTERDQFGNIIFTEITTALIDPSGNVLSETVIIYLADLGVTLTLNGS